MSWALEEKSLHHCILQLDAWASLYCCSCNVSCREASSCYAVRPYEDNTPKMPVGTKPKSATSAGSKASGPKSSSTQADASTWMPTGPDWKQNRPKGVYTLQEMFEGTGRKFSGLFSIACMHACMLRHIVFYPYVSSLDCNAANLAQHSRSNHSPP